MNSQPAVWLSSASARSQPIDGQSGCSARPPKIRPKISAATAAPTVALRHRAGDVRGGGRRPSQDQQVARVGDRRADAVADAGQRMLARCRLLEQPGHEHHADHHDRQRECHRPAWPLFPQQPRQPGHEQHLQVPENGRHAGADIGDRVGPQDQVDRQEHAGQHGLQPLRQRSRPVPALLDDREQRPVPAARAPSGRTRCSPGSRQIRPRRRRTAEMVAAPRPAISSGRRPDTATAPGSAVPSLPVRTVDLYGAVTSSAYGPLQQVSTWDWARISLRRSPSAST